MSQSSSPTTFSSDSPASAGQLRVAIAGAGVIGLGIAWQLARAGCTVDVFDAGMPGQGASHAAAGMLAACAEAEAGEEDLLVLNRLSQSLWPDFAAALEAAAGQAVDLRTEGTLTVGQTADDAARLRHLLALQTRLGLPVEWLSPAEARRREPHLARQISGAIFSPEDHQVDNRKVAAALEAAARAAGVRIHPRAPVARVASTGGRVAGVEVNGALHPADAVVLAAGAWSRGIDIAPSAPLPVRPIKGQMAALAMDPAAPLLTCVLWGPGIYLVPRRDGRLILGATTEEKGFDPHLTAGGQLSLFTYAWRVLPGIEELPILEQWVGFRPGSRDDAPILGPSPEVEGLFYATGHHRNGILLLPATVAALAALVLEGRLETSLAGAVAPFGAGRFAAPKAAE